MLSSDSTEDNEEAADWVAKVLHSFTEVSCF